MNYSKIDESNNFAMIDLRDGLFAIVDVEDFDRLNQHTWFINSNYYVYRTKQTNGVQKTILMHREIMGFPEGMVIDHANGFKLDNRKSNLRVTTQRNNSANRRKAKNNKSGDEPSSQYVGVSFANGKWVAAIKGRSGRNVFIGSFESEIKAAQLYNLCALELHGEFACINTVPMDDVFFPDKLKERLYAEEPRQTSSKFKGVYWRKDSNKWSSKVCCGSYDKYLGLFETEVEAALAYNNYIKENELNKELNEISPLS